MERNIICMHIHTRRRADSVVLLQVQMRHELCFLDARLLSKCLMMIHLLLILTKHSLLQEEKMMIILCWLTRFMVLDFLALHVHEM